MGLLSHPSLLPPLMLADFLVNLDTDDEMAFRKQGEDWEPPVADDEGGDGEDVAIDENGNVQPMTEAAGNRTL